MFCIYQKTKYLGFLQMFSFLFIYLNRFVCVLLGLASSAQ